MWLVFGNRTKVRPVSGGVEREQPCPRCGAVRRFVECDVADQVSLFFVPVVDAMGELVGIVEARDLLRTDEAARKAKLGDLARQDYVIAYPGELVDMVHRAMMRKEVENVVVVESRTSRKPVGLARANDIPTLRRWLLVEEGGELRRATLDEPADSPGVKLA